MKRIGLALGGGGAKGLAHVPILEIFDELGANPCCIAGTSVGALIGALYASGLSTRDILDVVDELIISEKDDWRDIVFNKDLGRIREALKPGLLRGSILNSEHILAVLARDLGVEVFEDLEIPLQIVATD